MNPFLRFSLALVLGTGLAGCVGAPPQIDDDATRALTQSDLTAWNEATVARVHDAMKSGRLSATLLTRVYLDRIARLDPALRSTLSIDPDAVEEARRLDRAFAATGKLSGPLHGLPIIVKDNIDVIGQPTTAGCVALRDAYPVDDAFVVKRLRAAGAIIIAKANLYELATFSPRSRSSLGGDVGNAYDPTRSPLGSSGGTATAVSANLALLGLGTDTNSSVLYPAAVSGLVGLRPTQGLVSRDGVVAGLDETTIIGPMTRTVTDAALLLDAIAGGDGADPTTSEANVHVPVSGYAAALSSVPLAQARLGTSADLMHSSMAPFIGAEMDPDVEQQAAGAITTMQAAGAQVKDVGSVFAAMAPMLPAYGLVLDGQALNTHHELNQYLAALRSDAPVRSVEQILASGAFLPELQPVLQSIVAAPETSAAENPATQQVREARRALRERVVGMMDAAQVDVLVYPTTVRAAAALESAEQASYGSSAGLSSQTGMPAVTVPLGYDRDGMPLGLTFLARPWDEARLLAITHAYESANPTRHAPPDRF